MQWSAAKSSFPLGLLCVFVVLAMSACEGGGHETAERTRARTIPENSLETEGKPLHAGEYVSDEFHPAMSFGLGEGWKTGVEHYRGPGHSHRALPAHGESLEMRSTLTLYYAPEGTPEGELAGTLVFFVDPRVYRVISSYEAKEVPTPEDMAAWLRKNPYLDTGRPEPATVGGEKGVQFDAVPSRVPEEYITCVKEQPCLPLFQTADPDLFFALSKTDRVRFLVLKDVQGKTVTIAVDAPAARFDEFLPQARKVLDTVKWRGA